MRIIPSHTAGMARLRVDWHSPDRSASSLWNAPVARNPSVVSTCMGTGSAWLLAVLRSKAGRSSAHSSTRIALGSLKRLMSQSSSCATSPQRRRISPAVSAVTQTESPAMRSTAIGTAPLCHRIAFNRGSSAEFPKDFQSLCGLFQQQDASSLLCVRTSMIGAASKLSKDGKTWWRQEASTTQHNLKNWKGLYRLKARHREDRHNFHVNELMEQDGSAFSFHNVMLWVVASLLTLVKDVFSEEDNKEARPDLQRVHRQPSLSPAEGLEQDSGIPAPWPHALEKWSLMHKEEIQQSRWRHTNSPRTSRRNRKKNKSIHDCHLERKEMRVRDLGLGYDSDEIVLFKYCDGTCHSSRKNYDLALKALMDNGSISGKRVSGHPCCRPTRYETVSFMDTQTTWQTIKWLSAADCSCVG
ncbi:uncharacterized protein LOC121962526 [Plectropomus leopardus]|uniref:uncharacterized protein LOC121962526 n=1 Tax=Plectropomus leopardus TaxID=160734 RepID=UPI001C4C9302|nr:uncharacterized protein LOC121962526 [Plectropomus leopardus]